MGSDYTSSNIGRYENSHKYLFTYIHIPHNSRRLVIEFDKTIDSIHDDS